MRARDPRCLNRYLRAGRGDLQLSLGQKVNSPGLSVLQYSALRPRTQLDLCLTGIHDVDQSHRDAAPFGLAGRPHRRVEGGQRSVNADK
ncbi:hypothetical protein ATO49_14815 [Mycolicibacterium fortuitum subsp. fortuitum DSM 46621 = ATCC 6841 = JCM 6387]|nr:hypothetical protein ATO49_14815 [Mycolicibacterium fortuitum subsp. fortuitum DSM 46621 = ATCC 6841 = JCM 6387]